MGEVIRNLAGKRQMEIRVDRPNSRVRSAIASGGIGRSELGMLCDLAISPFGKAQ